MVFFMVRLNGQFLTFQEFRKAFFNVGLGRYFSAAALIALFAMPEVREVPPGEVCRRFSELPAGDCKGFAVVCPTAGGNVLIRD